MGKMVFLHVFNGILNGKDGWVGLCNKNIFNGWFKINKCIIDGFASNCSFLIAYQALPYRYSTVCTKYV